MKVVENSPQNARNCTIFLKISWGACPQTPLAKARSFAACISKITEILKMGPPPLRNPAYAPETMTHQYTVNVIHVYRGLIVFIQQPSLRLCGYMHSGFYNQNTLLIIM